MFYDSHCASHALAPLHDTRATQPGAGVDAVSCAGRHLQPAAAEDCVGLTVQEVEPSFMAAGQEPQSLWFEQMMPKPDKDIGRDLLLDRVLTGTLQDPVESLRLYYQEVQRRREMESANQEYSFPPLEVTLRNMNRLTEHMLQNKQFVQPLASDEHSVLLKFQQHIQELIRLKAPYKRTVKLAFLMCILQEIITARHVTKPLRAEQSELLSNKTLMGEALRYQSPQGTIVFETADIPLEAALSCRWGGLNAHVQPDAGTLICGFSQADALMELLENHRLFLYPSFAALDLNDFCGLGHLPVYPLGMMSAYALNADGQLRTPLGFFTHDLLHTSNNQTWLHLDGMAPLESMDDRLRFQQVVRGGLPAALQEEYKLEHALELVVFYLFHEVSVVIAQRTLENKTFLPLFRAICLARRQKRTGYSHTYRAITDQQALLACFWVYRAYTHYRTGINLADIPVSTFVQQDVPQLLEHQRFIDQHREALHQHFRSAARFLSCPDGMTLFTWQSRSPCASSYGFEGLTLEVNDNSGSGRACRVRNTDLIYLDALLTDKESAGIEQALGVPVPASRPHRPA